MKNVFPIIILLVSFHASISQDKEISIPMEKDESMEDRIHLGENGFIIKTSEQLRYYSPACDLLWEHRIKKNYSGSGNTVASPDGLVVYNIDFSAKSFFKKTHYITQLKKNGQAKEFEMMYSKEYGEELIDIFCDNDYLYYLMLEPAKEKKKKDILVLNRFSGADLSHKKITLALPETQTEDSYWYYLGQYDNIKYLAHKGIEIQRKENTMTIVGIDSEGAIVKNVSILYSLTNKFIRAAMNLNIPVKEWIEFKDNDFGSHTFTSYTPGASFTTYNPQNMAYGTGPATVTSQQPGSSSSRTIRHPNPGAYSQISMDEPSGSFYIYSLLGPKPMIRAVLRMRTKDSLS